MAKRKRPVRRLTIKMRGNLSIVFTGIFCLFLVLIGALIFWNIRGGARFRNIVLGQQNHTSTTIPFERGKIYDRNDTILAANEKVYYLILEPRNMTTNVPKEKREETLETTVKALVEYFHLDEANLRSVIKENQDSYYCLYKENNSEGKPQKVELDFDQVEAFRKLQDKRKGSAGSKVSAQEKAEIEKAKHIAGVTFEENYRRIYPYGSLACRVLGYCNAASEGNWGIEQEYNKELNGTNGRSYFYFNEELTREQTVKEAVNGHSVVSTIDMQIQKIVEDRLKKYDETIGSKNTSILVMNPQNGEILAMAGSRPFDINDPMNPDNLKLLFSDEEIKKMEEYTKKKAAEEEGSTKTGEEQTGEEGEEKKADQEGQEKKADENGQEKGTDEKKADGEEEEQMTTNEGLSELWRNAIISDTKEPGSTFKPFTVAAGFENGTLSGKEEYSCEGSKAVGSRRIGCSHVHGTVNLKNAVAKSCNVAMMNIAFKEGPERFYYYQNLFGFGRKTGIDLPGEAPTAGLVYNNETYSNDVTLATNAFGQNFNCTMIQMAAGFASLINGGKYYRPHIIKQIRSDKGDVIRDIDKDLVRLTVSEETSRTLKDYLHETVLSGTGVRAQIPGYQVGGKTGTAEKLTKDEKGKMVRNKEDYYVSFLGFAPVDDPQVMIYVTIDEPNVDNQANAGPAVDLFRQCMERVLLVMNIEGSKEISQEELAAYEAHTGHSWNPEELTKEPEAESAALPEKDEEAESQKKKKEDKDIKGSGSSQTKKDEKGSGSSQTKKDDKGSDSSQTKKDKKGSASSQTKKDKKSGQDKSDQE